MLLAAISFHFNPVHHDRSPLDNRVRALICALTSSLNCLGLIETKNAGSLGLILTLCSKSDRFPPPTLTLLDRTNNCRPSWNGNLPTCFTKCHVSPDTPWTNSKEILIQYLKPFVYAISGHRYFVRRHFLIHADEEPWRPKRLSCRRLRPHSKLGKAFTHVDLFQTSRSSKSSKTT
jgi:hypothetical protein